MRVHHLSCATMEPYGARLFQEGGRLLSTARLVGHCVAVESESGVVLIDTGFGLGDVAAPAARLGRPFVAMNRPRLCAEDTAARQLQRLGLKVSDVRHVICTHLDPDHAGGVSDFPDATIHVHRAELEAAQRPVHLIERFRYRAAQFAHGPRWALHGESGERWFGFESVRAAPGLPPELLLIPLLGHSRGHTAVAVRTERGWLLHCGDAYFARSELDAERPRCPPALSLVQRMDEVDRAQRLANQERLRQLARDHAGEVELFCAHDATELAHSQGPRA